MGVRILALLAVAVGGGALEIDENYLTTVSGDLHRFLSSNLRALLQAHAHPQQAHIPALENAKTCGECQQFVAEHVLQYTVSKMKDVCEDAANSPDSCKLAKICSLMAKDPKVTLGMMIEHVRPLSLSTAFCMGARKCDRPDQVTMEEIATGKEPHEALLDNFDKVDWSEVQAATHELWPVAPHDGERLEDAEDATCSSEQPMHKVCPRCMKHSMRRVMGLAIMKVKAMCMKSDSTIMKKLCPWMAQNKEVALGMLVAKVEPWKFAFGFCISQKMHHFRHGKHGKHGHDGGHFHAHHDWHPEWQHHGHQGQFHEDAHHEVNDMEDMPTISV
jgi:hypothetical protein